MNASKFPVLREERYLDDVKRWIEQGGSPHVTQSEGGWTLLHIAAEYQCVEAIEYLISLNCNPNLVDAFGQTPLHIAVDSEIDATTQVGATLNYKTTKRLIELGADLTTRDNRGKTPLDWIDKYGTAARQKFDEIMGNH
jgi:ankyrin repeat protein